MQTMNIIFRSCTKVNKTSAGGSRPFKMSKEEIILKSLKSILESSKDFKKRIYLDIVDDSSDEKFRVKMIKMIKKFNFNFEFHRINVKNNGKSMNYCFKLAKESKHNLLYFCEDDYFHLKIAIPAIFDAYDKKIIGSNKFCIHPTDYPDRYIHLEPAYIFLGEYNHWRSILSTTGTFIIPKKIFLRYQKYCFDFARFNTLSTGGEESTINNIWKEIPCIAPLESFATHLNTTTLSPFVKWKNELNKIKI